MNHAMDFMLGPGLRAVLLFFGLAIVRRIILEVAAARRQPAGAGAPWTTRALGTVLSRLGLAVSVTAACCLVVTVLLAEHLALFGIRGEVGIPDAVGKILTVAALVGLTLVGAIAVRRRLHRHLRRVGRWFYIFLALTLVTGILVGHPAWCPLTYRDVLLIHIVSAEAVLVLAPLLAVRRKEVRS